MALTPKIFMDVADDTSRILDDMQSHMNIVDMLSYLNSADGPNIPLRTLSAYCGCANSTLSNYINKKYKPSEDME